MSENIKRRLLQVHLSTAIILMFVAAVLLWANLRPTAEYPGHSLVKYFGPGWPRPIFELWVDVGDPSTIAPNQWWNGDWKALAIAVLVNGLTGGLIIGTFGVASEIFIRRKKFRSQ
jgi:hypothetical protein